jgi:hypothetical protein
MESGLLYWSLIGLFYMGQANSFEGLKKGIKIHEDPVHKNSVFYPAFV